MTENPLKKVLNILNKTTEAKITLNASKSVLYNQRKVMDKIKQR